MPAKTTAAYISRRELRSENRKKTTRPREVGACWFKNLPKTGTRDGTHYFNSAPLVPLYLCTTTVGGTALHVRLNLHVYIECIAPWTPKDRRRNCVCILLHRYVGRHGAGVRHRHRHSRQTTNAVWLGEVRGRA